MVGIFCVTASVCGHMRCLCSTCLYGVVLPVGPAADTATSECEHAAATHDHVAGSVPPPNGCAAACSLALQRHEGMLLPWPAPRHFQYGFGIAMHRCGSVIGRGCSCKWGRVCGAGHRQGAKLVVAHRRVRGVALRRRKRNPLALEPPVPSSCKSTTASFLATASRWRRSL